MEMPVSVLKDICWSFNGKIYSTREEFDEKVRQYQIAILKKDCWTPEEVVIPCAEIEVSYEYVDVETEHDVEDVIKFSSDNGEYFSASELLFKINNAVTENLGKGDHHFFEGLGMEESSPEGKTPLYYLYLGS